MYLDQVRDGSMVFELRHLANGDESGNIIPLVTEDGTVVGHWVVLASHRRESGHDGKDAVFGLRTAIALS